MYYILGGNGFIGSAFARYLKRNNRTFEIISRENYHNFIGTQCTYLINANGNSSKIKAEKDPLWDFEASVKTVKNSLVEISFDKYIYLSSCDIYSDLSNPQNNHEKVQINYIDQKSYGFHKYLAELCVKNGAKDFLIFRLGGFVGEGLKKNAIYDILHGPKLWLNPKSRLQFLNTDDAARIIITMLEMNLTNEVFNLCGNGLISLEDASSFCGTNVRYEPNSAIVKYNINIEKIQNYADVPKTNKTILEFISSNKSL